MKTGRRSQPRSCGRRSPPTGPGRRAPRPPRRRRGKITPSDRIAEAHRGHAAAEGDEDRGREGIPPEGQGQGQQVDEEGGSAPDAREEADERKDPGRRGGGPRRPSTTWSASRQAWASSALNSIRSRRHSRTTAARTRMAASSAQSPRWAGPAAQTGGPESDAVWRRGGTLRHPTRARPCGQRCPRRPRSGSGRRCRGC